MIPTEITNPSRATSLSVHGGGSRPKQWSGEYDESTGGRVPHAEQPKEDDHPGGSAGVSGRGAAVSPVHLGLLQEAEAGA